MGSTDEVPVQAGDILARKYRVERILGKGNMGVVVAAMHVDLHQRVALKFMLPGNNLQREQHERFLREARAAVRLKSQHVARVLDMGTLEDGAPYIVMEFLEGQDLAALLHARSPLPVDEAVEYVLQTCEAVGEAHAAGIVHRDLKPANLFLTTDVSGSPCIKVLDFGISKLADAGLILTQDTEALGTPLYMSPEQMSSSKNVDARSDLWALGIILYQLVAGKTPFHAENMEQLCARVLFGQPTPLGEYRSDVPPEIEAAVLRCVTRDREQRWRNVAELAAALAPYAPARVRLYPERVARVLGVEVSPISLAAAVLAAMHPAVETASTPAAAATTPSPAETAPATSSATTLQPMADASSSQPGAGTPAPMTTSRPNFGSDTGLSLVSSQNAASSFGVRSEMPGGRVPPLLKRPVAIVGLVLSVVSLATAITWVALRPAPGGSASRVTDSDALSVPATNGVPSEPAVAPALPRGADELARSADPATAAPVGSSAPSTTASRSATPTLGLSGTSKPPDRKTAPARGEERPAPMATTSPSAKRREGIF